MESILNKEKYNIVIQNFEGPMDLLLYLISKHKMNIFDISLSELTDKYVEYLNELNENNIEVASEFIVMAATLLDIKARRLLPEIEPKEDDEEIVTEEDIINKIIEYKKYKEISEKILELYNENFGSFSKPYEKIKFKKDIHYTGQAIKKDELFELYSDILYRNANKYNKKAEEINKLAVYEKITVKDKVKQIVNYLNNNDKMVFNTMYSPKSCNNLEIATAFLGVLELSKLKQVSIEQEALFSDINVIKNTQNKSIKVDLSNIFE